METIEERASSAKRSLSAISRLAPVLVTLSLLLSASMGLHEVGSRFLGAAFLWRDILSLRLPSCLSHSVGLMAGFAFCIFNSKTIRLRASAPSTWIAISLLEAISVIGMYASLRNPFELVILLSFSQAASGFAAAIGLTLASSFACSLSNRDMILSCGIVCVSSALTVWGLLSTAEAVLPLPAIAAIHASAALAGGFVILVFYRNSHTFSQQCIEIAQNTGSPLSLDSHLVVHGTKRVHPVVLIWVVICVYGFAFGILHAIPLGLTTFNARNISKIIGAILAAILLYATFSKTHIDSAHIWNRIYRFVFPLAVISTLLLPFTQSGNFLPALACSECSGFYFDMVLCISCCVICKSLNVNAVQMFAHAFFARSVGYLVGDIAGVITYSIILMNILSIIGIVVFVLLCFFTFNFRAEKYAKTAWGILPKEEPHALFDKELMRTCQDIANAFNLTSREYDVLVLLAKNKRPKEIGEELVVSIATVRTHIQGIYNKLDVHSHDALMKLLKQDLQKQR